MTKRWRLYVYEKKGHVKCWRRHISAFQGGSSSSYRARVKFGYWHKGVQN
jgi:hypothetical protein